MRLPLALLVALACVGLAQVQPAAPLQALRALNTTELISALRLASECRGAALQDAAAAATTTTHRQQAPGVVAAARLEQLADLLPTLSDRLGGDAQQLAGSGGLLAALQATVGEELALRAARRPSRLARALTLTNIAWCAGSV